MTLTGKRILLGELLEELSRQSGHTLRLGDDRDAVSGIELAVNLTGQPLGEVMSSLEALFSSRFNQWEFQKAGERVYLLRRQRTIAAAVAAARAEIGRRWAADLDSCIAHAKQPDLTREQWAKPRPDLFPGGVVDHGRMDLLSALKPLEVEALKRGAFVPLDPAKLGKRAAGAMSLGLSDAGVSGEATPPGFYVDWKAADTGPVLWLRNRQGVSANAVGGWVWGANWLNQESEGWRGRADDDVQRFLREKVAGKAPGRALRAQFSPEWLEEVGKQQKLAFLVDLVAPGGREATGGSWLGAEPALTVKALIISADLNHRPNGAIHLFRSSAALVHERPHLTSWGTVKRLRGNAARNAGFLDMEGLTALAGSTPAQLAGLRAEFGCARVLTPDWQALLRFLDLLPAESQVRLQSDAGIPFTQTGLVARAALSEGADTRRIRGLKHLDVRPHELTVGLRLTSEGGMKSSPRSDWCGRFGDGTR